MGDRPNNWIFIRDEVLRFLGCTLKPHRPRESGHLGQCKLGHILRRRLFLKVCFLAVPREMVERAHNFLRKYELDEYFRTRWVNRISQQWSHVMVCEGSFIT